MFASATREHSQRGKIERIEQDIQAPSPEELAQFRAWFLE
jgi:hypothetical protein